MENISYVFIAGLCVAMVSTLGLLLVKSNKKVSHFINHNLIALTSLSAGIFLVTSFLLIRETLEILPLKNALLSFALGIGLYMLMYRVIKPHRHMGEGHVHNEKHSAYRILLGDALHNIADGLLLVASFGASTAIGISNTVSVILHELPQELSEFFVLKKSGYTNKEAVSRNFATALSVFLGIVLGMILVKTEIIQAYLLGATATFFLGIVFMDLFPVKKMTKEKTLLKNAGLVFLGIVFMSGVSLVLGHSHEHGEHTDEHMHGVEHFDNAHEPDPYVREFIDNEQHHHE